MGTLVRCIGRGAHIKLVLFFYNRNITDEDDDSLFEEFKSGLNDYDDSEMSIYFGSDILFGSIIPFFDRGKNEEALTTFALLARHNESCYYAKKNFLSPSIFRFVYHKLMAIRLYFGYWMMEHIFNGHWKELEYIEALKWMTNLEDTSIEEIVNFSEFKVFDNL
eukprot:TRINITY_DN6052_c0_g2_i6.p1 TRINITY_DN6052_c0_g2~~TRINITY_DN6052_c0_g2_i6.p1  ORF type:complete len:186 (-),score=26.11 TRINITY_DN6052_c0_g2_i6:72-563(-)